MGLWRGRVGIVGAGHLAWHILYRLRVCEVPVVGIWNRTAGRGEWLARRMGVPFYARLEELVVRCDVVWLLVADRAIPDLAGRLPSGPVYIHSSGSLPLDVLAPHRRGVIYPLGSFHRARSVDWLSLPVFVEWTAESRAVVEGLAMRLFVRVGRLATPARQRLHRVAVVVNNLVMWLLRASRRVLYRDGEVRPEWFLPILRQAVENWAYYPEETWLSGPAVRGDVSTVVAHWRALCASDQALASVFWLINGYILSGDGWGQGRNGQNSGGA